jgi:hypothetical protein
MIIVTIISVNQPKALVTTEGHHMSIVTFVSTSPKRLSPPKVIT